MRPFRRLQEACKAGLVLVQNFLQRSQRRMRHIRQLCLAAALIFTFAFSVYAGEIECPGVVEPPPQAAVAEIVPDDVMATDETPDGVTDTLLWLILSIF
jgi:hypothetical protein